MKEYGEGSAGVPLTFRREAGTCGIDHRGMNVSMNLSDRETFRRSHRKQPFGPDARFFIFGFLGPSSAPAAGAYMVASVSLQRERPRAWRSVVMFWGKTIGPVRHRGDSARARLAHTLGEKIFTSRTERWEDEVDRGSVAFP